MATIVSYHGSLTDYHGTYVLADESVNAYAPPECQRFTLRPYAAHGTTETLSGVRPESVTLYRETGTCDDCGEFTFLSVARTCPECDGRFPCGPAPALSPTGDGLSAIAGGILAFLSAAASALNFERGLDHYHYGEREGARWYGAEYVTGATFSFRRPLRDGGPWWTECDGWEMDDDKVRAAETLRAWAEHLQAVPAA